MRSASTPLLHCPIPHSPPPIRTFSPSIGDLSGRPYYHSPTSPTISPISAPARPFASSSSLQPLRNETHYYTAATPPIEIAGSKPFHPPKMVGTRPLSPEQHSPVSPHLQNYAPSFPGSSYVPPRSVPSSPLLASDPQNLIPYAVRGAGYNPFQHSRSTIDLAFD
jgi:hypothetical protein